MAKAKKTVKKKAPAKKSPAKKAAPKKAVAKKSKKTTPKAKAASKKTSPVKAKAAVRVTRAPKAAPSAAKTAPKDFSDIVTPLDDRVLVRMKGVERQTAGGLFIPDTVADVSGNLQGQVVAVGRGRLDKKGRVRPMDIQLGDRIVFGSYAGSKINILGEDLVLLREGEVLGIIS